MAHNLPFSGDEIAREAGVMTGLLEWAKKFIFRVSRKQFLIF
jgi:hypothetical protein